MEKTETQTVLGNFVVNQCWMVFPISTSTTVIPKLFDGCFGVLAKHGVLELSGAKSIAAIAFGNNLRANPVPVNQSSWMLNPLSVDMSMAPKVKACWRPAVATAWSSSCGKSTGMNTS